MRSYSDEMLEAYQEPYLGGADLWADVFTAFRPQTNRKWTRPHISTINLGSTTDREGRIIPKKQKPKKINSSHRSVIPDPTPPGKHKISLHHHPRINLHSPNHLKPDQPPKPDTHPDKSDGAVHSSPRSKTPEIFRPNLRTPR